MGAVFGTAGSQWTKQRLQIPATFLGSQPQLPCLALYSRAGNILRAGLPLSVPAICFGLSSPLFSRSSHLQPCSWSDISSNTTGEIKAARFDLRAEIRPRSGARKIPVKLQSFVLRLKKSVLVVVGGPAEL